MNADWDEHGLMSLRPGGASLKRFPHGLVSIGAVVLGIVVIAVTFLIQLPRIHDVDVNGGVDYTTPAEFAFSLGGVALVVAGLVYGLISLIRWSGRRE
ncbi:hypothetical protein MUN74_04700 [Agromyces endophyticus]|uniref:hypothetical protein n=1 Tax=Agromyces sp. H17E-10 TaxID=2932244 RepID=UPI001FD0F179|nr:hypothetical protein [Agromyces sp. H17E-10]UOQ90223.1 hypothetical protein MUN74_04700 [Agromyces sp. H17E-10]